MNTPQTMDPLAEQVLSLLKGKPEAREIILGGYFALRYYVDYRATHDIDAWWRDRASPAAEQLVRQAMSQVPPSRVSNFLNADSVKPCLSSWRAKAGVTFRFKSPFGRLQLMNHKAARGRRLESKRSMITSVRR